MPKKTASSKKTFFVADVMAEIERLAPREYAYRWDRVGLRIGDPAASVKTVAAALEATEETVREAARLGANLLVVHHPALWEPLHSVQLSSPDGRLVRCCLENKVAVYAAHTNWDLCPHSMTRHIGERLGLKNLEPDQIRPQAAGLKVVVFVPEEHLDQVRKAMTLAGAGTIGDYSECSFSTPGTGAFHGGEGANPALGKAGHLEFANERRLEMVVPAGRLGLVLRAMTESHPYEEVAYDIFQTEEFLDDRHLFWLGDLERPVSLKTLAARTAKALSAPSVRYIGRSGEKVQKIVLCSGGGKSLLSITQSTRADVLLTGDLDYHAGREAEALGLSVIDGGHFHTEKFFGDLVTGQLRKSKRLKGLNFQVIRKEKSPFQYVGPRR